MALRVGTRKEVACNLIVRVYSDNNRAFHFIIIKRFNRWFICWFG